MVRSILGSCLAAILFVACNSSSSAVPAQSAAVSPPMVGVTRVDTTSILKLLKKNVRIGSTVDPSNGDTGPRSLALATQSSGKIETGDLAICNFANSSGQAGKGTTVELLPSTAGSKPSTFVQSQDIEGCDGAAIVAGDEVYVGGLTSKKVVVVGGNGRIGTTLKWPADPLSISYGPPPPGTAGLYSPYFVFVGDMEKGAIVNFSLGGYGTGLITRVVRGFAANGKRGWGALGPSGLAYNSTNGTLYVVDGPDDSVVAISNAPNLVAKDEIVVQKGGEKFKCKHPKKTCAKVVYSGPPLDKPFGEALLPNGNLIVANTDNNKLVELTPTGKVLDTKTIDNGRSPAIFALWAVGTSDYDTALFYTDINSNTVQELTQ